MPDIRSYKFDPATISKLKSEKYGFDWPVVYLIENGTEAYIGETVSAFNRLKQHHNNPARLMLSRAHIIADQEYNKSATLDIESWLIQYMAAEGSFVLQNNNAGLTNHSYFDREKYRAKFEIIWEQLQEMGFAKRDLVQIQNTDVFKYSPYKALTDEQLEVVQMIYKSLEAHEHKTHIVNGEPGTGKSVVGAYLAKFLVETMDSPDFKLALVVPMTSLRKTLKKVFSNVKGLKSTMVIGPNEVVGNQYDLLIVDEAHRLHRRINITNYQAFDKSNKLLGLDNEGTELDWILMSSKSQVLFYDKNQSVRPSDIRSEQIETLDSTRYTLTSQLRVLAGDDYIQFIDKLLTARDPKLPNLKKYDLRYFENAQDLVATIKQKDKKHSLARVVAGYAWSWESKNGKQDYDIELDGLKLKWNSKNIEWVNSKDAVNEVGCIHTVQGYDLNYVGVIIGPEVTYDPIRKRLLVNRDKYMDINGKRAVDSDEELEKYVLNIYKTLLTRGIKGTYIHAVDKKLEKYLINRILKIQD